MPMTWNADADAKLFACVMKVFDVKVGGVKLEEVADLMGPDCSAKAVTHRLVKIRSQAVGIGGASANTNTNTNTNAFTPKSKAPLQKGKGTGSGKKSGFTGNKGNGNGKGKGKGKVSEFGNAIHDVEYPVDDEEDDEEEGIPTKAGNKRFIGRDGEEDVQGMGKKVKVEVIEDDDDDDDDEGFDVL